jgi:Asp-tRNA(Asn)/Glu-tRNA(Gln) amidotransferase A subunit family amidase
VPFDYDISEAFYYSANSVAMGDFVGKLIETLRGETPIEEYKLVLLKEKLPMSIIHLVGWFKNKDPTRFKRLVNATINKTMKHLTDSLKNVKLERLKVEQMMLREGIEGIMAPGGALPALKHTFASHLLGAATYAMFFNMVNFPAGSIPITFVKEDEQHYDCPIDDEMTRYSKDVAKGSAGLPIGVQVGCPPNREELVLNIMKRYEAVLPKVQYPTDI